MKKTNPTLKIRINNLEFRAKDSESGEFIIWDSNKYFGQKEKMLSEGWEEVGGSLKKDYHNISLAFFSLPEICYTIADLKYDKKEGGCDLNSVGSRILNLGKEDRELFFEVYKIAEAKLLELNVWRDK